MADQEQPVGGAATRQSVGFTLSQLRFATSRRFGQITGTLGLELRHIALLRAVSKIDGQSQQAVAERLHILASTMAALIDHLEQQEMVERRPHPSDRRARLLYLAGHGREVLGKAASFSAEWENYIQAGLWRGFAVRDGNLITGQQNFSGGQFARWSSTRSDDNSRRDGRATFQAELDALSLREKPPPVGDAIAAARRRLPVAEVDAPDRPVSGPAGVHL